jgi:hypothetical protein
LEQEALFMAVLLERKVVMVVTLHLTQLHLQAVVEVVVVFLLRLVALRVETVVLAVEQVMLHRISVMLITLSLPQVGKDMMEVLL